MSRNKDSWVKWGSITIMLLVICAFSSIFISLGWLMSKGSHPTYAQVCAPLHPLDEVDYYDGRIFVVCGSPTTQPILKEYPRSP